MITATYLDVTDPQKLAFGLSESFTEEEVHRYFLKEVEDVYVSHCMVFMIHFDHTWKSCSPRIENWGPSNFLEFGL